MLYPHEKGRANLQESFSRKETKELEPMEASLSAKTRETILLGTMTGIQTRKNSQVGVVVYGVSTQLEVLSPFFRTQGDNI